jgi:hypothetical protein
MPFTEQEKRTESELLQHGVDPIGTRLFEELEGDLSLADAKRIASALARAGRAGWQLGEAACPPQGVAPSIASEGSRAIG